MPTEHSALGLALTLAVETLKREFGGDLLSIILTGSAHSETSTEFSDVDLCVLTRRPFVQRQRRTFMNRRFDIFVDPPERIEEVIGARQAPFLILMYANCRIILDTDGTAKTLIEAAKMARDLGRAEPDDGNRFRYRSEIVDIFLNILESTDPVTVNFLVGSLVQQLVEAYWLENRLWSSHRKLAMSTLAQQDHRLFAIIVSLTSHSLELERKKGMAAVAVELVLGSDFRVKMYANSLGPVVGLPLTSGRFGTAAGRSRTAGSGEGTR